MPHGARLITILKQSAIEGSIAEAKPELTMYLRYVYKPDMAI